MMTTPRHIVLRGAALACCVCLLVLAVPGPAAAGWVDDFTQSLHNWSDHEGEVGPSVKTGDVFPKFGTCSACHVPHFSGGPRLWPRSLSNESDYYDQQSTPNYIPGTTLLCYDCHDTGDIIKTDDDPPRGATGVWLYSTIPPYHEPQDIALSGIASDINLWGTTVGYYELIDGTKPTTGTVPTAGDPTGGHYWKSEPNDAQAKGDKIACELCHDVHDVMTGTAPNKNDAFFRTTTWDGTGWQAIDQYGQNLRKSQHAREPQGGYPDLSPAPGQNGRKMCASCHGYSDLGSQKTFFGVTAPKPPTTISAHTLNDDYATALACTNCHKHNKIVASCSECHGFPPMLTETEGGGSFLATDPLRKWVENYTGGAGAHRRHVDALGTTVFDCAICHGPNAGSATWHNNGSGTVTAANVDIIGKSSWWDPDNTRGPGATGYVGTSSSETLPPAETGNYEFVAKGGGNQRCFGLACHGDPPNTPDALNWTDNMLDDGGETATFEIAICTWCHDSSPAALDKDGSGATYGLVKAPNIMGNGSTWGSDINGHGKASGNYDADAVGVGGGLAAANKGCAVCHDATYTAGTHSNGTYAVGGPDKAHYDGSYASAEKRLNDTINSVALSGAIPVNGDVRDAACIACHQNTGSDQGAQVSSHGNHFNGSYEAAFQRECRACHEPHGRNWNGLVASGGTDGRNLHMVGKWLDSSSSGTWGTADDGEQARVDSNATDNAVAITTADARVVFTANTGDNSYDDGYDDSLHESICVVCHVSLVNNHNQVGDTTLQGNGHNPVGSDCMVCHAHDFDNQVATAYDGFGPSAGPDMEQFFDAVSSATNYNAVSGHPLDISVKVYATPPDCIGCHQTSGGSGVSNECLKCHYEGYVSGSNWVWAGHANGSHMLELRTPASPDPPYNAACAPGTNCIAIPRRSANVDVDGTDDVYTHCLTCHDGATVDAKFQLGNPAKNPPDIVPSGKTWTAGMGHGNGSSLSSERGANAAGPPDYDCGACHSSTQPADVDEEIPSYHASVNLKLVANTTAYATPEYDTTVEKNTWCATHCHGVNGANRTDKVIDHTWAPDSSETANQTGCPTVDPATDICETHPSYDTIDDASALYQLPANLPYDTGTKQFTCRSCHEPHGNSTATDGDQMIRINYSDGTLCLQCHEPTP